MPWSGTGITDTILSESGFVTVPDKAYANACVNNFEEGMKRAEEIGYPVMIKASEGGGGKGIRKVENPDAFKNAFYAVAGEIPGLQFACKSWYYSNLLQALQFSL
jgi:acetyl-CoA carboxylase/biotin carboxylase 1